MASVESEYGYVILAAVAHSLTMTWMGFKVGAARKKFGVSYPTLYATAADTKDKTDEAAKAYNCVQRGHQNSLENTPVFFILLLTAGIGFPVLAAASGLIYTAGRVVYMLGYSTGDPAKRNRGAFGYIGLLTLLVTSVMTGIRLVTA